jgi:hypothetical protein
VFVNISEGLHDQQASEFCVSVEIVLLFCLVASRATSPRLNTHATRDQVRVPKRSTSDKKAMGLCTHVVMLVPMKRVEPLKCFLVTEPTRVSGGPTSKQSNRIKYFNHQQMNTNAAVDNPSDFFGSVRNDVRCMPDVVREKHDFVRVLHRGAHDFLRSDELVLRNPRVNGRRILNNEPAFLSASKSKKCLLVLVSVGTAGESTAAIVTLYWVLPTLWALRHDFVGLLVLPVVVPPESTHACWRE